MFMKSKLHRGKPKTSIQKDDILGSEPKTFLQRSNITNNYTTIHPIPLAFYLFFSFFVTSIRATIAGESIVQV